MGVMTTVATGTLGPNEHLIGRPGSRYELDTPAVVIDLDRLDANIATMAAHAQAGGYALRPPVKIHKCSTIAARQVAAGALGMCCSTVYEAEVCVRAGLPGTMIFNIVRSQPKLDRIARLNRLTEDLIVATDHDDHVTELEQVARTSGRPLAVMIDVEVGGGRTGMADRAEILRLARRIADSSVLTFAGVQGYVGNHQNHPDLHERAQMSRDYLADFIPLVEELKSVGLTPRVVTGGGTGTHDIDHELGVFTEIQAGSYVFGDVNYRHAQLRRDVHRPFAESMMVHTKVISASQPGFVITDAGTKEINGYSSPVVPIITGGAPAGATYSLVGDDMGRVDFALPGETLAVGDRVEVLPPHAFQTITHYRVYHVVQGDTLIDIWPIDALMHW